jgi:microcompartment protein CcmK/EutM
LPYIALDVVGAGPDELVVVVEGSSARVAARESNTPVDAVIVGILDSLQFDGKTTFKKH